MGSESDADMVRAVKAVACSQSVESKRLLEGDEAFLLLVFGVIDRAKKLPCVC